MDEKTAVVRSHPEKMRKLRSRFFLPKFMREMKRMGIGGISGGNSVDLITEGDEFFSRILDAIENASKSINLETYIFRSDAAGWMVAEGLAQKARAGVEVNVIYDAVGCLGTSPRLFNSMREAGVEVMEYHPLVPWRKYWGIDFRDHRKILVIDGDQAL